MCAINAITKASDYVCQAGGSEQYQCCASKNISVVLAVANDEHRESENKKCNFNEVQSVSPLVMPNA